MTPPKGEPEGLLTRMARFVRAPAGAGAAQDRPPGSGPSAPEAADPGAGGPATPGGLAGSAEAGLEVAEFAYDPELEDAAIRFAGGDDAGAQAALLALLAPGSARAGHEETWLALFDFLRATGQQAPYEDYALAFASRFGRSAPQWQAWAGAAAQAGGPPQGASGGSRIDWACPRVLDAPALAALRTALARQPAPWCLSWVALARIERDAVEPLGRLLADWAAQPLPLQFVGADELAQALAARTVAGERASEPAWWTLRMQALRVMQRPDEFEQVALDYCVTHEVSPPSWDQPRCQFQAVSGEAETAWPPAPPAAGAPAPAALAGAVQGDATELLRRIEALQPQGPALAISCAQLVRIDFTAAGTLLNWATARQAEGRQVHLTDVHRLVASFLDVIGVSAQARVSVRRD